MHTDELTQDGKVHLRVDYKVSGIGSNSRPVQQLIDFQKVAFAVYERITLTFTVTEEMLRFWNNENILASEPGTFELSTGYADHLQHTKRFELV